MIDRLAVRRRTGPLAAATAVVAAWVVLLTGSVAVAAPDPADRKKQVEEHLDDAEHELHHSSVEVQKAAAALKRVAVELPKAQARLADARAQLTAATDAARQAAAQSALATSAVDASEAELSDASGDLRAHRDSLGEIARAAYIRGPAPHMQMLLDARSASDLVAREVYVDRVMHHEAAVIGAVGHARSKIKAEKRQLEVRRDDARARQRDAEAAVAKVTRLTKEAERAEQAVREQLAARKAALAAAERERAKHEAEVKRLEEESKRLEALIRRLAAERARRERIAKARKARAAEEAARRARRASRDRPRPTPDPSPDPSPQPPSGRLIWPTAGPITSSFGYRVHPIFGTRRLHAGIDIGAPSGQSVSAADGGVVSFSGWMGGYGNVVLIDHGRLTTAYAHLSSRSVGAGQRVSAGERIGRVGSTGNSTGPHLHFETRLGGTPVNPMNYF